MEQEDFKVEAYGIVTPPPGEALPEPDDVPTTGAPDDEEEDD
jgi:hypothetical protein